MNDKDFKITQFTNKLKLAFVDRYEDIEKAKNLVNDKLKQSNINFSYTYNSFCVDLVNEGVQLVNRIDDIEDIELSSFLFILLNNMVINKIDEIK